MDYFQTYKNYFWHWEDDHKVLAIPDSLTIAYRELLVEILQVISKQGAPPFGSLILAIIATNPTGREGVLAVEKILKRQPSMMCNELTTSEVIKMMNLLVALPDNYKKYEKRIQVIQVLFENCHHVLSLQNSKSLAKEAGMGSFSKKELTVSTLQKDLKPFYLLNKKFKTPEDILKKIANLPAVKEGLLLEEEVLDRAPKDAIEELIANDKTHKVGALVKTIWAGINLPFHSISSSEQPIGGVSDLTNKGNLDQLLISEFANDELVFLSRLANNEALFLSREAPPASKDKRRVLLIDVSLKNWGTPKIVAFATMLAIVKHPKSKITCEAFVLGDSYHKINFESVDDIVNGLEIVKANLDASGGLNDYFNDFPTDKDREVFVLTEKSTPQQPAMQKAISELGNRIHYFIYNDSEGAVAIYKKLKNSQKHVQHFQIPLQRLWGEKVSFTPIDKKIGSDYCPILIRGSHRKAKIKTTDNQDVFQVSNDKTLLRLHRETINSGGKGWEIIHSNVAIKNKDFEIGRLENNSLVVLTFDHQKKEITILNLTTKEEKLILFSQGKSNVEDAFLFEEGHFFYCEIQCWRIELSGEVTKVNDKAEEIRLKLESRKKENNEASIKYQGGSDVFKNIRTVSINSANNLVFNAHELSLNSRDHIRLHQEPYQQNFTNSRDSKFINEGFFQFSEGSSVAVNRVGIITLKSSNANIPTIYIPSVIGRTLGVATPAEFAGNVYYYNEPMYEITLNDAGLTPLKLISKIKEHTQFGLRYVKDIVDNSPQNLQGKWKKKKVMKIKAELELCGAKVDVVKANPTMIPLDKISTTDFFNQYIDEFINTIITDGT